MNGKVHIIEDDAGHQIFPSIVSYFDNGGKRIESIASLQCVIDHIKMSWLDMKL